LKQDKFWFFHDEMKLNNSEMNNLKNIIHAGAKENFTIIGSSDFLNIAQLQHLQLTDRGTSCQTLDPQDEMKIFFYFFNKCDMQNLSV